jgi:hypothetical protein
MSAFSTMEPISASPVLGEQLQGSNCHSKHFQSLGFEGQLG